MEGLNDTLLRDKVEVQIRYMLQGRAIRVEAVVEHTLTFGKFSRKRETSQYVRRVFWLQFKNVSNVSLWKKDKMHPPFWPRVLDRDALVRLTDGRNKVRRLLNNCRREQPNEVIWLVAATFACRCGKE